MLSIIVRVKPKRLASSPTIYTLLILFPFFLFNDLHVFILCPQISMGFSQAIRF